MKERILLDCNCIFFPIFFVPLLLSERKWGLKGVKDYFVPDSYFFNWRIGACSGSELWGVLPDRFYQLKAPISILLCYAEVYF